MKWIKIGSTNYLNLTRLGYMKEGGMLLEYFKTKLPIPPLFEHTAIYAWKLDGPIFNLYLKVDTVIYNNLKHHTELNELVEKLKDGIPEEIRNEIKEVINYDKRHFRLFTHTS